MRPLDEQTILITGSTSGLGRHVAGELARRGAAVLVHGRDPDRTRAAAGEVGAAGAYVADLSSLAEAHRLAREVAGERERLHALVCNAGVLVPGRRGRQLSRDGHELHLAVNHLAHFAISLELLPLLRASAPARLVSVSSGAQAAIDFDDVMLERGYGSGRAYAQSKLAQVMMTLELAERVDPGEVAATALHPASLMDTRMVREAYGRAMSSVEEGGWAVLRLVADPGLDRVSGAYFEGTREARADGQAYDPAARRRLWELSEELAREWASSSTG